MKTVIRTLSLLFSVLLLFTLVACAIPAATTETPLPPSATPDEIKALKADERTELTCLYALPTSDRYTADSIWIDESKEELLTYESALLDRFRKLENDLNVTLSPYPIEITESGFGDVVKTILESGDPTVDIVIYPQSLPIPDGMKTHFVKTNEIHTESGSVILGDVMKTDACSVLGRFSLTAFSEPIALYLNESLLQNSTALLEMLPDLIKNGSFTFEEFLRIARSAPNGIAPLIAEKSALEAYLTVAFSAKTPDDAAVQSAIDTLENEALVSYESDPVTAFSQNRALFIFAPIGELGIGRTLRDAWNTVIALPLPKANRTDHHHTCYSERLDLYSISKYSDNQILAAATLAYLDEATNSTLYDSYYRDLYACRCPCIRSEIWKETAKVYENDCIFRLIALDKAKKG